MSNLVVSWIRTVTPVVAGALITWAVRQGFLSDASVQQPLTEVLTAAVTAAYYFVTRSLETWWPGFGWLLGVPKAPVYAPPAQLPAGNVSGGAYSGPERM